MEKGEHLKRQNRPTMLQLQYLQGLSRVEKKRGAQGSIAESYGVNRSTVNRYFKNCIERGILTETVMLEFCYRHCLMLMVYFYSDSFI